MGPRVPALVIPLSAILLATACGGGGGDAPTSPSPSPAPGSATLTLDFANVEVLEDCDGIEGDGDFSFEVLVTPGWSGREVVVYREIINLGPGGRSRALGRQTFTTRIGNLAEVLVSFRATELDRDIFGSEYNDERLSNASAFVDHVLPAAGGAWSNLGAQSITLGSPGCRVRLNWTASGS